MAYFNYNRRKSSVAQIGDTPMGGENPIRIQSMANVSTMDTEAAVAQAIRMIEAGAEYVRFTAQGEREARNLGEIRKQLNEQGYTTPLVADIHFNPRAADAAAGEVEKVRIISRHLPVTCEAADCRRYLYFDSDSSRAFHLLIGEKWRGRRYRAFRPEGAGGSLSDFYHFHLGMYLFPV